MPEVMAAISKHDYDLADLYHHLKASSVTTSMAHARASN